MKLKTKRFHWQTN